ncbi:hypothetical protein ACA910_013691 [Epithemia clementina (nom. ined.)]
MPSPPSSSSSSSSFSWTTAVAQTVATAASAVQNHPTASPPWAHWWQREWQEHQDLRRLEQERIRIHHESLARYDQGYQQTVTTTNTRHNTTTTTTFPPPTGSDTSSSSSSPTTTTTTTTTTAGISVPQESKVGGATAADVAANRPDRVDSSTTSAVPPAQHQQDHPRVVGSSTADRTTTWTETTAASGATTGTKQQQQQQDETSETQDDDDDDAPQVKDAVTTLETPTTTQVVSPVVVGAAVRSQAPSSTPSSWTLTWPTPTVTTPITATTADVLGEEQPLNGVEGEEDTITTTTIHNHNHNKDSPVVQPPQPQPAPASSSSNQRPERRQTNPWGFPRRQQPGSFFRRASSSSSSSLPHPSPVSFPTSDKNIHHNHNHHLELHPAKDDQEVVEKINHETTTISPVADDDSSDSEDENSAWLESNVPINMDAVQDVDHRRRRRWDQEICKPIHDATAVSGRNDKTTVQDVMMAHDEYVSVHDNAIMEPVTDVRADRDDAEDAPFMSLDSDDDDDIDDDKNNNNPAALDSSSNTEQQQQQQQQQVVLDKKWNLASPDSNVSSTSADESMGPITTTTKPRSSLPSSTLPPLDLLLRSLNAKERTTSTTIQGKAKNGGEEEEEKEVPFFLSPSWWATTPFGELLNVTKNSGQSSQGLPNFFVVGSAASDNDSAIGTANEEDEDRSDHSTRVVVLESPPHYSSSPTRSREDPSSHVLAHQQEEEEQEQQQQLQQQQQQIDRATVNSKGTMSMSTPTVQFASDLPSFFRADFKQSSSLPPDRVDTKSNDVITTAAPSPSAPVSEEVESGSVETATPAPAPKQRSFFYPDPGRNQTDQAVAAAVASAVSSRRSKSTRPFSSGPSGQTSDPLNPATAAKAPTTLVPDLVDSVTRRGQHYCGDAGPMTRSSLPSGVVLPEKEVALTDILGNSKGQVRLQRSTNSRDSSNRHQWIDKAAPCAPTLRRPRPSLTTPRPAPPVATTPSAWSAATSASALQKELFASLGTAKSHQIETDRFKAATHIAPSRTKAAAAAATARTTTNGRTSHRSIPPRQGEKPFATLSSSSSSSSPQKLDPFTRTVAANSGTQKPKRREPELHQPFKFLKSNKHSSSAAPAFVAVPLELLTRQGPPEDDLKKAAVVANSKSDAFPTLFPKENAKGTKSKGATVVTTWKRQDPKASSSGRRRRDSNSNTNGSGVTVVATWGRRGVKDHRSLSDGVGSFSRGDNLIGVFIRLLLTVLLKSSRSFVAFPFLCFRSWLGSGKRRTSNNHSCSHGSSTTTTSTSVCSSHHWKRRSFFGSTALRLCSKKKEKFGGFRYPPPLQ